MCHCLLNEKYEIYTNTITIYSVCYPSVSIIKDVETKKPAIIRTVFLYFKMIATMRINDWKRNLMESNGNIEVFSRSISTWRLNFVMFTSTT